jgi:hypothetical protein
MAKSLTLFGEHWNVLVWETHEVPGHLMCSADD